eukprot:762023-Pelagomonas_calceolata.AAC.1
MEGVLSACNIAGEKISFDNMSEQMVTWINSVPLLFGHGLAFINHDTAGHGNSLSSAGHIFQIENVMNPARVVNSAGQCLFLKGAIGFKHASSALT